MASTSEEIVAAPEQDGLGLGERLVHPCRLPEGDEETSHVGDLPVQRGRARSRAAGEVRLGDVSREGGRDEGAGWPRAYLQRPVQPLHSGLAPSDERSRRTRLAAAELEASDLLQRDAPAGADILERRHLELDHPDRQVDVYDGHGRSTGVQQPAVVARDQMCEAARLELVVRIGARVERVDGIRRVLRHEPILPTPARPRYISPMPRFLTVMLATAAVLVLVPSAAQAASGVACEPVRNPYPGTRYEGVDLTRIRAVQVPCSKARRVARGAHRKALGLTPPASGVRRFRWRGWRVTGDLRPAKDRYVARKGARRVRWRF